MQRYEKKLRYASSEGGNCVEYAFYMHTLMPITALIFSMCAPSADE